MQLLFFKLKVLIKIFFKDSVIIKEKKFTESNISLQRLLYVYDNFTTAPNVKT